MSAAKLDILHQGRELAEEVEIPRGTTLVSRQTAAAAIMHPGPAIEPVKADAPKAQAGVLDDLSEEVDVPVALNVRVAPWVNDRLNELIFAQKARGRRIRKEKVVEAAIIAYLGLIPPDAH